MSAYGYMDVAVAGLPVGASDARTVDSPSAQEAIEFGRPVFGYLGENTAYNFKKDVAILAIASDLVTSNSSVVTVNGEATSAVVFATDHDTTIAALVVAIQALGVEAVLDPSDSDSRTILIRSKGEAITAAWAITGGTPPTITAPAYASGQVFLGISQFHEEYPGAYAANDPTNVMRIGSIYATCNAGPEQGGAGYVADTGVMDDSGTAITSVQFGSTAADTSGLVVCDILGITRMAYAASF